MQPIVVRPVAERRATRSSPASAAIAPRSWRASPKCPVIVRDVPDEQALAMALIENIQREDLNPLEQAQAITRLIDEFDYSHEQAAEAIGRSRSATSNLLRLLNLAEPVQTMLLAGDLDMGHARALLARRSRQPDHAGQSGGAEAPVGARSREAGGAPAGATGGAGAERRAVRAPRAGARDRDVARLQEQLSDLLGTTVTLQADRPRQRATGHRLLRARPVRRHCCSAWGCRC